MSENHGALALDRYTFDNSYVQRLLAHDRETEAHFTRYFGELMQIKLRARLRSGQLLDDIRQETFLRVFRSLREGALQHPERIGAFVNSVCNNVMLEHLRSAGRSAEPAEENFDVPDNSLPVDQALITSERRQQVRKILDDLPQQDRDLLRSVFLDEEDKDAVCRRYNVDRNYLRVLLHRARVRMRQEFTSAHFARLLLFFGV
jgi:RNA polymerase sigma-70 factor (ECF subfamily)